MDDPELTSEQQRSVENLSAADVEEIDMALLAASSQNWRKVAFVVGTALLALANRFTGVPDVYFSQRIQSLVRLGKLNSQGNLLSMRFSEVRLPTDSSGDR
jgi:hypothetical protein